MLLRGTEWLRNRPGSRSQTFSVSYEPICFSITRITGKPAASCKGFYTEPAEFDMCKTGRLLGMSVNGLWVGCKY